MGKNKLTLRLFQILCHFVTLNSRQAIIQFCTEIGMEFSVVEKRTLVSSPTINVTFSDGYMDTIVLWKHYSNKEEKRSIEDDKDCNYLGHLLHEKEACVAMTGCVGKEDVVLTIMSKHATDSSHFVWTKEGKIHTVKLDPVVSISF